MQFYILDLVFWKLKRGVGATMEVKEAIVGCGGFWVG